MFEFTVYANNLPALVERLSKLDVTVKYKVTVSEWKAQRSLEQNKWIRKFATEFGKHLGYQHDEMYELLMYKFNPIFITDKETGEQIKMPGHFSKLKTNEAAEVQNQVLIWAESLGFFWDK